MRLLLVDDHTLFRRGMIALLSSDPRLAVVAEAADAGVATRLAREHQPDVILLDNHLPGVNGVDALPGLREVAPQAKILMLTVSEDEDDLTRALKAGAAGYLLKTAEADWLVGAILRVVDGDSVISPELTEKLIHALRADRECAPLAAPAAARARPQDALSPRESEILREIARGGSNKEIARRLDIAETTVKVHVQAVLRKLGLASRVQAAVYAVENGLI
ncbi:MAG: response regulator [Burkholderiaceae bacterium]|nr:response regulator [Burkholderiaceae bacterium]